MLVVVFGFFFATVSSRITGLIGSSSNPISGMTIATLIITCVIFVALGWNDSIYAPVALSVGAIICIAAANAGQYVPGSQNRIHRRGHAAVSADWSCHRCDHLVIRHWLDAAQSPPDLRHRVAAGGRSAGHSDGDDHSGLVEPGTALGARVGRCIHRHYAGAVRHPFAVVRRRVVFANRHDGTDLRRRRGSLVGRAQDRCRGQTPIISAGTLFSSGLIAGGSLAGILYAILVGTDTIAPFQAIGNALPFLHGEDAMGQIFGGLLFFALAVILGAVRAAPAR